MSGLVKKGIFKGLTVRLQGTGKNNRPYTIYDFPIQFESGKVFNLGIQSWKPDILGLANSIPVGSNVSVTTDDKNNVLGIEVLANPQQFQPPAAQVKVDEPPKPAAFKPAPVKTTPGVLANTGAPKPPERIPAIGLTKEEIRAMSVDAAVKFYVGVLGKAEYFSKVILKSETDESLTTKVMDFAHVVAKYISGCGGSCDKHNDKPAPDAPIADKVSPMLGMPEVPSATPDDDDIPF